MDNAARDHTIALLAPMQIELDPLIERLMLRRRDADIWQARFDGTQIIALLTTIGMGPARAAAERAIALGASVVAVVGVAGGLDPTRVRIGEVIRPARVVDRATGQGYEPAATDHRAREGTLSCGDDLIVDADRLAALAHDGVIALDMETAAVAAACTQAAVPWTAFRAISDFAGAGLVSDEIFAMTKPDGTADGEAIAAFLAADPARQEALERLARDAACATAAAADAAIGALPALVRLAAGR